MASRIHWNLFLIVMALAAAHIVWAHGQVPDTVATHFGGDGQANGWSSRSSFTILYIVLVVMMGGLFALIAALLPRLPEGAISMPNRDYWLAPERRAKTMRRFGDRMLVFGCVSTFFVVGIMHLTVLANRTDAPRLGASFWLLFTAYMVFTLVWTVWLVLGMRVPRRPDR